MNHILVIGDSFSSDWSVKYNNYPGWPNLLSQKYKVTNVSQAGCSEYKIRKQLDSVDLGTFSHCIVSHTSPYRIPVEVNPLHVDDILHHSCDFIYADVCESNNYKVSAVKEFFEKYFFTEYYDYMHWLIVQDIHEILKSHNLKSLHMTFFDVENSLIEKNYHWLFEKFPGVINHVSPHANQTVFEEIDSWISK